MRRNPSGVGLSKLVLVSIVLVTIIAATTTIISFTIVIVIIIIIYVLEFYIFNPIWDENPLMPHISMGWTHIFVLRMLRSVIQAFLKEDSIVKMDLENFLLQLVSKFSGRPKAVAMDTEGDHPPLLAAKWVLSPRFWRSHFITGESTLW